MSESDAENGTSAGVAASIPSPRGTTTHGEPQRFPEAFETCDGEAVQRWVGRQFSAASEAALLKASGAASLRAVGPRQPMSRDYRTDRLTIELDSADVIIALRCG